MSYRVSFVMDQIAGHVTSYSNLRSASLSEPDLEAAWYEIRYYKPGGVLERVRETMFPFASSYVSGIMRGAWEVKQALRDQDEVDAIFTNTNVGVFFTSRFTRVPTMIDFDATPVQIDAMEAYGKSRDPKPLARLKWRLSRRLMQSAAVLQAWSNWARRSAIEDYGVDPEKVIVNPPGIDLSFWKPAPSIARGQGALRILFVGADFRRKGGHHLLEWYRRRRTSPCELHIVTREEVEPGDGVFVYRDMKPNSDRLLGLFHDSDLFVMPSLGECFGIATVEAMGAGLPVIASDVGGTADIVDHGRNGFIVPAGNVAELGRAIESILSDADRRAHMATASRRIAEERFDLSVNARKTFGHLRRIAGRTPAEGAV